MLMNCFALPRRPTLITTFLLVVTVLIIRSNHRSNAYLPELNITAAAIGNDTRTEWKSTERVNEIESLKHTNVANTTQSGEELVAAKHSATPEEKSPFFDKDGSVLDDDPSLQHMEPPPPISEISTPQSEATLQQRIQELLHRWKRPRIRDHWPPYEWFENEHYDPNLWEGFEWDNSFYTNNGARALEKQGFKAVRYSPYPNYNSQVWKAKWRGEYNACYGPEGKRFNESEEGVLWAFPALPKDFPQPAVGDAAVVGIDLQHCLDRDGRLGPYKAQDPADLYDNLADEARSIKEWGRLQDECLNMNQNRFLPEARQPSLLTLETTPPERHDELLEANLSSNDPSFHSRTALLIRSWQGYPYTENDVDAVRSLVSELSLQSGGEYQVFLFVNIKNRTTDFYTNSTVHDEFVRDNVPKEFEGITILWNEPPLSTWYPDVGDWQVYWQQFMPLQWFSKNHPEYDFIWNWEVDARYTGNHYQFLEALTNYSRHVPRKFLWERNARYYIPSAHGTFDEWIRSTDAEIRDAVKDGTLEPVWGPKPFNKTIQTPIGPKPPCSIDEDNFEWGIGEEADLIALQPIWDPQHTKWTMRDQAWNFIPGVHTNFHAPDDEKPDISHVPRRAYINTVSRFSKRMLHAMHVENLAGRSMQAEMWPATVALHHGLKAVYAPHPIWTDRKWPPWYMDAVFNAKGKDKAAWNAREDTAYNHDREHNFGGWTWFYQSDFPRVLYRRWLGWSTAVDSWEHFKNNPLRVLGGNVYEDEGQRIMFPKRETDEIGTIDIEAHAEDGKEIWVGGNGPMCLPPMLLHPVKHVLEDDPGY